MDTQYCLLLASMPNGVHILQILPFRKVSAETGACLTCWLTALIVVVCFLYKCYINNFNHILLVVSINDHFKHFVCRIIYCMLFFFSKLIFEKKFFQFCNLIVSAL